MNGTVHTLIGVTSSVAACIFFKDSIEFIPESSYGLFVAATMVGSTFPDLDLPGRPLGFLGHRKFTHTLTIPIITALLTGYVSTALTSLPILCNSLIGLLSGFVWGYVLHILADLFQSKGCPLLWPIIPHNIHIASIPVKYDMLCFAVYFAALVAFIALRSGSNEVLGIVGILAAVCLTVVKIRNKKRRRHGSRH